MNGMSEKEERDERNDRAYEKAGTGLTIIVRCWNGLSYICRSMTALGELLDLVDPHQTRIIAVTRSEFDAWATFMVEVM